MSWANKLSELQELFIGVAVAVAVLVVVAWLIGLSGSAARQNLGVENKTLPREPLPREMGPSKDQPIPALDPAAESGPVLPTVAALYIATGAGAPMTTVGRVEAIAGRGLVGDRYNLETGHWSGTDDCEVTIIAQEDIDEIGRRSDVRLRNGEHRRNIVIRNLAIDTLTGRRFYIGSACFGYERPRPPCAYIQLITEPGMTKALGRRAGICARCIKGGTIQVGDQITILHVTLLQALKYRANLLLRGWRPKAQRHG